MSASVACPSCQRKLNVPEELLGRRVKCPGCGTAFSVTDDLAKPAPGPAYEVVGSAHVPPPLPDTPRPDRDVGKPPRPSNLEPHRGTLILVLGIISIVSIAVPFIVGLVCGIAAWVLGSADLKKIRAGRMDPTGESSTQAGYVCGIIGTVIHGLITIGGCIYFLVVIVIFGLIFGTAYQIQKDMKTQPFPRKMSFDLNVPLRLADYLPRPEF